MHRFIMLLLTIEQRMITENNFFQERLSQKQFLRNLITCRRILITITFKLALILQFI